VAVVAGQFSESIEMWRGTMQAARSLEFIEPDGDRNGYAIESAPGHPGLLALALPWEGTAAHAQVMSGSSRIAPLIALTRDGGSGRVSLTRSGRPGRLRAGSIRATDHACVLSMACLPGGGATEIGGRRCRRGTARQLAGCRGAPYYPRLPQLEERL
jgi:hypothetical protein